MSKGKKKCQGYCCCAKIILKVIYELSGHSLSCLILPFCFSQEVIVRHCSIPSNLNAAIRKDEEAALHKAYSKQTQFRNKPLSFNTYTTTVCSYTVHIICEMQAAKKYQAVLLYLVVLAHNPHL